MFSQVNIGLADDVIKKLDVAVRFRVDVSLSDASTFIKCAADTTLATLSTRTITAIEKGITIGLDAKGVSVEADPIKQTDEVAIQVEVGRSKETNLKINIKRFASLNLR